MGRHTADESESDWNRVSVLAMAAEEIVRRDGARSDALQLIGKLRRCQLTQCTIDDV